MTALRGLAITPTNPAGPTLVWELYGDARLSGGIGGWESLPTPRQLDRLEWVNQPHHTLTLTLAVSGTDYGPRSIEADLGRLASYGKPSALGVAPPLLSLAGPIRQPAPFTLWVLQGFEETSDIDVIRDPTSGALQQIAVQLTFEEYTGATILLGPAAAARARAGK